MGSDLSVCSKLLAIKIKVRSPGPLIHLITELPKVSYMPLFDSKSSAGVELLRNVAESLSHASNKHDLSQNVDIAKPIAECVSLIKPRFEKTEFFST